MQSYCSEAQASGPSLSPHKPQQAMFGNLDHIAVINTKLYDLKNQFKMKEFLKTGSTWELRSRVTGLNSPLFLQGGIKMHLDWVDGLVFLRHLETFLVWFMNAYHHNFLLFFAN